MSFGVDLDTGTEAAEPSSNSSQELRQLQPSLQSLSLAIDYRLLDDPKDQTSELRLIRGKKPLHTPSRGSDIIAEARRDFPFQVQHIDAESAKELLQQRPDSKIVGASVRHFFPFQIGVIFNKSKDIARKIASAVASLQSSELHFYYGPDVRSTIVPAAWSEFVLQTINNTITSQNETIPVSARTRSTLQHLAAALPRRDMPADDLMEALKLFLRRLDPRDRASIRSALAENQEKLELKFLEIAQLPDEQGFDPGLPHVLAAGIDQASAFFQQSIRYLGPLRDEPKPVYPLEALVNPTDVGYRGEHTAAVLDLHRYRIVGYIKSQDVNDLLAAKQVSAPLHAAVVDWLSYLGVAESVRTADLGKMGHQLQVKTDGRSKEHDLTNVGVGVSQLLPIIVLALLAPSPALLIFEQPELHLHPKVQARLVDFFFYPLA